jgi:hypothetical protein
MCSETREPVSFRGFSKLFTGLLLIVSPFLAGCNRRTSTSPNLALTWTVAPQPVRVGRTDISLNLSDTVSKPVAGAQIQLEADMAHPGMAPVFSSAKEVAPGKYEGALDINMPGDWVVLVHGRLANGQKFERQIEMNGVEAK